MQRLQVSSNGRYLITEGGQPFFWLGHAAPADLDAAHAYLRRCRDQGYTVIQTDQPELVALAAEYGLYGALIADPGDDLSAGAALYGRYLRRMVRDAPPAVYLLSAGRAAGGDQPHWRELAAALDDPAALMAYQPPPGGRSSDWFAHDAWSAFHALSAADAAGVSAEWSQQPVRPALELHGDSLRQLYNVVFAGCCGVTCDNLAAVHLRRLLHSRPYLSRIPDQSMLISRTGPLGGYPRACRDRNRSYAMIYVEGGRRDVEVRLAVLSGTVIRAWWYDPHTGESVIHGDYLRAGTLRLTTPVDGDDWVLVLDDRDRNFPSPGISYF